MNNWIGVLSRHITTIVIIITSMWWLATPRAEEFIRRTVNTRITTVETKLDVVQSQLREIIRRLDRIEDRR